MDATASAGRARAILAKPRRGGATAFAAVALAAARIGDNRRRTLSSDAMNPLSFAPIVQNPVLVCAMLLTVSNLFMTFAVLCMDQPIKLDYLWAALCLMGAVYFIFRG